MHDKEVHQILDNLKIFEKVYEIIRLVDPLRKKTINIKNNTLIETNIKCFDFWEKTQICDNCISMRAFNENKTFVKVEYSPKKVYMITAIPIEVGGRIVIIEVMKDATDSMVFANGDTENGSEIYAIIDNMNNLALKDVVTGLYNRRYINERLPIDLINAVLSEQSLSIIIADIDFFKKINDTYGHLSGDCVLKGFADTILACIKGENRWVSRYGGEEFLICIPNTENKEVLEIAEYIRKTIENKLFCCGEYTIKLTSSFGICTIKPSENSKIEELIEIADKKLYIAKNNGRNRVEG